MLCCLIDSEGLRTENKNREPKRTRKGQRDGLLSDTIEKREEKRRLTKSGALDREVMIHEEVEMGACVRDMINDAADVISKRVSSIAVRVHNQISCFFFPFSLHSGFTFFCVLTERGCGGFFVGRPDLRCQRQVTTGVLIYTPTVAEQCRSCNGTQWRRCGESDERKT